MYKIYTLLLFVLPIFKIDSMHLGLKTNKNLRFNKSNFQMRPSNPRFSNRSIANNKFDNHLISRFVKKNNYSRFGTTKNKKEFNDIEFNKITQLFREYNYLTFSDQTNRAFESVVLSRMEEAIKIYINGGGDINIKYSDSFAQYGGNFNLRDENDHTLLMKAIFDGNYIIAKMLINTGADVNIQNNDRVTALILAAANGNEEIVELLINANADVNIQDEEGTTALMIAAKKGHREAVEVLIWKDATLIYKINEEGQLLCTQQRVVQIL